MRTTKTISVSLPPSQLRDMERTAKRENRTMSELLQEAYRRYVEIQAQPATLREALQLVREDARQKGANRLTRKEISAEIAAYRKQQGKKRAEAPGTR